MLKALSVLPEQYQPHLTVDLQKNKKSAVLVNGLAVLIGAVMALPMHYVVSIDTLFDMSQGPVICLLRMGVLLFGMIAYMVLHEAVHGMAMKMCGTKKIKYGFTGLYAFAGSNDYYGKGAYIFIALAPIVLLGAVLLIANLLVPNSWFWVIYIIQIINVSGAAGDMYVTVKFIKLPKNILVQDSGTSMVVYAMH